MHSSTFYRDPFLQAWISFLDPGHSKGLVANILEEANNLGVNFISWICFAASMKFLLYFFLFYGLILEL